MNAEEREVLADRGPMRWLPLGRVLATQPTSVFTAQPTAQEVTIEVT
jgi:hypothetical protein